MSHNQQDALQGIAQDARRLLQAIGRAPTISARASQEKLSSYLHITLPSPQPINDILSARGIDAFVVEKLNQVYLSKAMALKKLYEDKHRQALKAAVSSGAFGVHDMDQFRLASIRALLSRYQQSLSDWQAKIDEIHVDHPSSVINTFQVEGKEFGAKYGTERRPTFKNESVPVLEKAFLANAYPSRTEKESLAEETGMEYKQVNIWFQNRRARSKKDGASLQRTATFATQLFTTKHSATSPVTEPRVVTAYSEENSIHTSEVCIPDVIPMQPVVFPNNPRPAHAFPAPFPPLCDESFSVRSGESSFHLPWLRRCVTNSFQTPVMSIEQLTAHMAGLSLSSDASSYQYPLPSFALILPRAPLPALIRAATASSCAQPIATRVSVAGLSSESGSKELKRPYHTLPTRLPDLSIDRRVFPQSSPAMSTRPMSISSRVKRSRPYKARSPSPPYSSRSLSTSSMASSRSVSSSRSIASSAGPLTPTSSSSPIEAFSKDISPSPPSLYVYRSSSIVNAVLIPP